MQLQIQFLSLFSIANFVNIVFCFCIHQATCLMFSYIVFHFFTLKFCRSCNCYWRCQQPSAHRFGCWQVSCLQERQRKRERERVCERVSVVHCHSKQQRLLLCCQTGSVHFIQGLWIVALSLSFLSFSLSLFSLFL